MLDDTQFIWTKTVSISLQMLSHITVIALLNKTKKF